MLVNILFFMVTALLYIFLYPKYAQAAASALPDSTQILSWKNEEQVSGFQNMHQLKPVKTVAHAHALSPYPLHMGEPLQLQETKQFLRSNHVAGLLILRGNTILLEHYAKGVSPQSLWATFSITKSVTGFLLGAAIKKGTITNLDDPVDRYLPELRRGAYAGVSIRHILTMTSGVEWSEDYLAPDAHVIQLGKLEPDPTGRIFLKFMAGLSRKGKPGTVFNYSTGEANLIGRLVRKITGKSLTESLSETIWKPMGMEADATWRLDKSGLETGGHGLSARLRDLGRLGLFVLQEGGTESGSILPADWVRESFTPTTPSITSGKPYGYQCWIKGEGICQARGIFGQMLHIDTLRNFVLVQISTWDKPVADDPVYNERQRYLDIVTQRMEDLSDPIQCINRPDVLALEQYNELNTH